MGKVLLRLRNTALGVLFLIASFLVGLGATGVAHQIGWLIRGHEPLIGGMGQAAQRMSDSNRQKSVFVAAKTLAATNDNRINPTKYSDDGLLLHGWQTALLPFLDEQATYEKIDQQRPWNHLANHEPFTHSVPIYLSPIVRDAPFQDGKAITHYTANALIFSDPKIRRLRDMTDGLANTIYSGKAAGNYSAWGHPANWRDPALGINQSPSGFGSDFRGGTHVVMGDGSVKFVTDSIAPKLLQALATPRGGEDLKDAW